MMVVEMMDTVVVVTGLLRLFLVVAVFYLNCRALFVVCFRSSLCSHNLVSTAVVLANILYLITWPPFLIYGLSMNSSSSSSNSNGGQGWTPVNEQVFCLSQNYVVNAMGMVLLSLLVVRLTDRVRESVLCWPALGCTRNVLFTFLMWLLPQLVYDLVSLATNGSACGSGGRDGQRRRTRPVFHFLGEIVRIVSPTSIISTSSTSASVSASASASSTAGYSLGFMVCEQELTDVVVAFHLWQYLVLVVPYAVAALLFGAAISLTSSLRRRRLHRRLSSTDHFPYSAMTETSHESCGHAETTKQEEAEDDQDGAGCGDHCRRRMVVVDLILYGNILWHLLGRPLVILHTLYWSSTSSDNAGGFGQQTPPPTFLDVGSHLMLAVSCCFAPTICGLDHALPSAMTTRSVVSFLRLKSTNRRSEDGEVEQDFRFVKDKPPHPA